MSETVTISRKVVEPQVDFETLGKSELGKFFDELHPQALRLARASNDYLNSGQDYASGTPVASTGVGPALEHQITNMQVYANNPDEIMHHMADSAKKLTEQVSDRLKTIGPLTEQGKRLDQAFNESSSLLQELFGTKTAETFDATSQKIAQILDTQVSSIREGAAGGKHSAAEVTEMSQKEQFDFDRYLNEHQSAFGETVASYKHSLQSFAETARGKEVTYGFECDGVVTNTRPDASGGFKGFIATYRGSRFPSPRA